MKYYICVELIVVVTNYINIIRELWINWKYKKKNLFIYFLPVSFIFWNWLWNLDGMQFLVDSWEKRKHHIFDSTWWFLRLTTLQEPYLTPNITREHSNDDIQRTSSLGFIMKGQRKKRNKDYPIISLTIQLNI